MILVTTLVVILAIHLSLAKMNVKLVTHGQLLEAVVTQLSIMKKIARTIHPIGPGQEDMSGNLLPLRLSTIVAKIQVVFQFIIKMNSVIGSIFKNSLQPEAPDFNAAVDAALAEVSGADVRQPLQDLGQLTTWCAWPEIDVDPTSF